MNRLRGLLGEYGIVIGQGLSQVRKRLPEILEDGENGLSGLAREMFADLHQQILERDRQVAAYSVKLQSLHQASEVWVQVVPYQVLQDQKGYRLRDALVLQRYRGLFL